MIPVSPPLMTLTVLALLACTVLGIWATVHHRRRLALPYEPAAGLFTPAERAFLHTLDQAAAPRYRVFGKVRIADLVTLRKGLTPARRQTALNRVAGKHFDFVVCRSSDLAVVCAIELDDSSHARRLAHKSDAFKDAVCRVAGLPLLRIRAAHRYAVAPLRAQLHALANQIPSSR